MAFNKLALESVKDALGIVDYTAFNTLEGDVVTLQGDVGTLQTTVATNSADIVALQPKCGSFYKSANQAASNGATDITFDSADSWTDGGYITSSGGANLVCATAGVYRLDAFLTCDPNGQTWGVDFLKLIAIDVTRSPDIERGVVASNTTVASPGFWSVQASGLVSLEVGDVINVRTQVALTSAGQYIILGAVAGTLDKNTEFQFQYIKP